MGLILSTIEMERQLKSHWDLNSTVAFIGDIVGKQGAFIDSYGEKWMVVWISMPLKLVKGLNGERYMVALDAMWHRSIPSHDLATMGGQVTNSFRNFP